MKLERKNIAAAIKRAGDDGSFEAVIATLNEVDSDGDVIVPGAFGNATISIVPAHDHKSVPLGKAKMQDRKNLAVAVGQFNLKIAAARDWHAALKFDLARPPAVQEWSFGFRVLDEGEDMRNGQRVRVLKKMDVLEISPVLRGAGVNTRTLTVKEQRAPVSERRVAEIQWRCFKRHGDLWLRQDIAEFLASQSASASTARLVDELQRTLGSCSSKGGGYGYRVQPGDAWLHRHAERACHHLGMPVPNLYWLQPCSQKEADLVESSEILGICTPEDGEFHVCVRDDLNLEGTLATLGHELHHVRQFMDGRPSKHDEDTADRFGLRFANAVIRGTML